MEMCIRRKLDSVHLIRVNPEDEDTMENLVGREVTIDVDWTRRSDQVSRLVPSRILSTHRAMGLVNGCRVSLPSDCHARRHPSGAHSSVRRGQ